VEDKDTVGIIKRQIKWKGQFLSCSIINYRDRQGIERQWECVERVNTDGIVIIVPINRQKEVIVIRQYRPPLNAYIIEFPAGLCDKGELIEQAAQRELLEETGYGGGQFTLLTQGPVSVSSSRSILHVFLAHDLEYKGSPGMDENEDIQVLKTTLDKFYDHMEVFEKTGAMVDLKIYGFLELAKRKLRKEEQGGLD
jgi:ADP-ribose pyrophosphatase